MAGLDGVNGGLASAFQALQAASPFPLGIISGYRSYEQQAALYAKYKAGQGNLAAPPGSSNHESGNAIDLNFYGNPQAIAWVHANAPRFGVHFPVNGENWHMELVGGGGNPGAGLDADTLRYNLVYGSEEAQNPEDVLSARLEQVMDMITGGEFSAGTPEEMLEGDQSIEPTSVTPTEGTVKVGFESAGGSGGGYGGPAAEGDQLSNARTIAQVGRQMGMTDRQIQIALAAALVESDLINVNYGDRDSLGLFQQRPSQGWGSPAQVRDPVYAARKFYEGLSKVNWQGDPGAAAQAVQRSAYPDRYGERFGQAVSIFNQLGV